MQCPRCKQRMTQIRVRGGREGGAYRDNLTMAWGCLRCGCRVLERTSTGDVTKTLARSMLVRERAPTVSCTACLATMERLTLSWGEHWVQIEECPRCERVLLDSGELERIRTLVSAVNARPVASSQAPPNDPPVDPVTHFFDSMRQLIEASDDDFAGS